MKKMFYCMAMLCLVLSCKKESSNAVVPFVWPEGTGEYAPYTTGSTFVYEVRDSSPASIDSFTYTVIKDTLIDGLKFRKLKSSKTDLADHLYCHYANGVRTEISYRDDLTSSGIITIKNIVLKADTVINTSWNNQINLVFPGPPFNIPMKFTYTLVQKGFTKNVLQKDYPATVEMRNVISIGGSTGLPPYSDTTKCFYSKGHGLIMEAYESGSIKLKRSNIVK